MCNYNLEATGMKTELTTNQLEAWRAFYVSYWKVSAVIEESLAAAKLPSLSWYDVLYQLYCAPGRRRRMSELAHGALMSRSGLTRLVDRLEREKLIERQACPSDKRGFHAHLTAKGLALLREMWAVYRAGIAAEFARHLTEPEAAAMALALGKVVQAAEARSPLPAPEPAVS